MKAADWGAGACAEPTRPAGQREWATKVRILYENAISKLISFFLLAVSISCQLGNMYLLVTTLLKASSIAKISLFDRKRRMMFTTHQKCYHLALKVASSSIIYDHVDKVRLSFPYDRDMIGYKICDFFSRLLCQVTRLLQRRLTFATWQIYSQFIVKIVLFLPMCA